MIYSQKQSLLAIKHNFEKQNQDLAPRHAIILDGRTDEATLMKQACGHIVKAMMKMFAQAPWSVRWGLIGMQGKELELLLQFLRPPD